MLRNVNTECTVEPFFNLIETQKTDFKFCFSQELSSASGLQSAQSRSFDDKDLSPHKFGNTDTSEERGSHCFFFGVTT